MSHAGHTHNESGNIKLAFFLNLGFTIFEIIGGLWTNSIAILSDALHDFGDSLSLGLAWFLANYAQKGEDAEFSYGYRRFSLLGAMITTTVLILGSLVVLWRAIPRLWDPPEPYAPGMVLFALVGIAVNGYAALRVRGGESLNTQAVGWHLLEDVLGWIAVLIVSIVLLFADLPMLDPLLSIGITLYVGYNTINNLRKTMRLLLQAVPDGIDLPAIKQQLAAIAGVQSTHHTHVWSLDGEHHVLSTHLVVADSATKDEVLTVKRGARAVTGQADFAHVTVEVEYEGEDCRMAPLPHREE
jgi:cobalt-zinc-cadmium efflux system protein